MYIRKATRTYKGKTYTNYLLVESHLTPKGPRQKVVCSLGDLSPRPKQQWLDLARKLESTLSGQQNLFAAPSADAELQALMARLESGLQRGRARAAGPLAAGLSKPARKRSPSTPIVCGSSRPAKRAPCMWVISFGGGWAWTRFSGGRG